MSVDCKSVESRVEIAGMHALTPSSEKNVQGRVVGRALRPAIGIKELNCSTGPPGQDGTLGTPLAFINSEGAPEKPLCLHTVNQKGHPRTPFAAVSFPYGQPGTPRQAEGGREVLE